MSAATRVACNRRGHDSLRQQCSVCQSPVVLYELTNFTAEILENSSLTDSFEQDNSGTLLSGPSVLNLGVRTQVHFQGSPNSFGEIVFNILDCGVGFTRKCLYQ